jgi:hypothetical protein
MIVLIKEEKKTPNKEVTDLVTVVTTGHNMADRQGL